MKSLREQFVDHLKENIESKLLIDINNHHENYINWLENKVKQSEEDKTNILKSFDTYRKLTFTNEELLKHLIDFVNDKNIIIRIADVKQWFEAKKKSILQEKKTTNKLSYVKKKY